MALWAAELVARCAVTKNMLGMIQLGWHQVETLTCLRH